LETEMAMLRIVSTLLLSGALALGAMSSASAQSGLGKPTLRAEARVPLAAGPAAGIKEAQAQAGVWNYVPFAVVGGLALLVVLVTGDDDEDASVPTTGTN
jgi:hypothetical protein